MNTGEFILYTTEDGAATIQLRAIDGTVWLTQAQMAAMFESSPQAMTQLLGAIYRAGELTEAATCKRFLQVQTEGDRPVERNPKHYNLSAILAVGYRVRSQRGIQFRRWASTVLQDYLVKGFAMDDAKLKGERADHFDELIERIRDIRASEARFYQKLRDILSLSVDYVVGDPRVQTFYATIQNKMLHAVTSHTAAELIVARADPSKDHMGLTSWKGGRVRKSDVTIAKNYLGNAELSELNLIVTMFLDTADLRARRRQDIRLTEWETILDEFIKSNELPLLRNAGQVRASDAERVAHERYGTFNTRRSAEEKERDDAMSEIDELKRIAEIAGKNKRQ